MKIAKLLLTGLVGICLLSGLTGCRTANVKILDPNSDPVRLLKGAPYTPLCDGYFVPDSTYLRILDRLSDEDVFGPSKDKPRSELAPTGVTNLVTAEADLQRNSANLHSITAIPVKTAVLGWDYPVYTNGLAFEIWRSADLTAWSVLTRTNRGPVLTPADQSAEFFKIRSYTYTPAITNYGDWASN